MQVKVTVEVDAETDGFARTIKPDEYELNSVLFDFNPTTSEDVAVIKALSAALISVMHKRVHDGSLNPQQRRNAAIAITEMEAVQMRAVKSLFAK